MTDLLSDLGGWEYREARRRVSAFGEAESVGEPELLAALSHAPALPSQYGASSVVDAPGGPITWFKYEMLLWALGDSCRRVLKRTRRLRQSTRFWHEAEAIALNPAYGKGRESFVMLLGQYGGRARVPVLLELLDDPEVQGHALYALRLLGAGEAAEQARALLGHRRTWVRNEAKKYLAKIGESPPRQVAT